MRELKFRGWSIDGGKWCSRVDYDGYKEKWTGIVEVNSPIEKDKYIGEYVAEPEEIIVEQYTGLKDKNGKEIYEGDIVKINPEPSSNKASVYKIVWDETNTMFDMEKVEKNKCRSGCELTSYFAEDRLEVIGNIHENKELLR